MGWGWGLYTLPCGAVVAGHTGALPGDNSGSFRLLGGTKDARVVANLHPHRTPSTSPSPTPWSRSSAA